MKTALVAAIIFSFAMGVVVVVVTVATTPIIKTPLPQRHAHAQLEGTFGDSPSINFGPPGIDDNFEFFIKNYTANMVWNNLTDNMIGTINEHGKMTIIDRGKDRFDLSDDIMITLPHPYTKEKGYVIKDNRIYYANGTALF